MRAPRAWSTWLRKTFLVLPQNRAPKQFQANTLDGAPNFLTIAAARIPAKAMICAYHIFVMPVSTLKVEKVSQGMLV